MSELISFVFYVIISFIWFGTGLFLMIKHLTKPESDRSESHSLIAAIGFMMCVTSFFIAPIVLSILNLIL